MKTAKWLGISVAAALAVGGVAMVTAQTNGVARPRLGGGLLGAARLRNQLGLSAGQTATIKADIAADKDTLLPLMSSLHDARINLRETIRKPGATEDEVRAAAAKVAAVEADLAVERAKLYGKISPVLTPEQLAKLNELQQRMDDMVDGAIAGFGRRLAQ